MYTYVSYVNIYLSIGNLLELEVQLERAASPKRDSEEDFKLGDSTEYRGIPPFPLDQDSSLEKSNLAGVNIPAGVKYPAGLKHPFAVNHSGVSENLAFIFFLFYKKKVMK